MLTAKKLTMDSKHRIVLGKRLVEASGIKPGEELLAIPFQGGIMLASAGGRTFAGSLTGFDFEEGRHEATEFITKATNPADP